MQQAIYLAVLKVISKIWLLLIIPKKQAKLFLSLWKSSPQFKFLSKKQSYPPIVNSISSSLTKIAPVYCMTSSWSVAIKTGHKCTKHYIWKWKLFKLPVPTETLSMVLRDHKMAPETNAHSVLLFSKFWKIILVFIKKMSPLTPWKSSVDFLMES